MNSRFLIADIANAITKKIVLHTSAENIVRDYLHPEDFHLLVTRLLLVSKINCAVDCFSKSPIDKFSLLSAMSENFGLQYKIVDKSSFTNATGKKTFYHSLNRQALELGYTPKYSSLEAIVKELDLYMNE
jgi:nucleoside-diphosphate-sugar epimerase